MTRAYSEKGKSECSYQESNLRPTTTSFSNRQRVRANEPVSLILAGKRDSRRHFTTSSRFCENGVVAKTSPLNVSDLVALE